MRRQEQLAGRQAIPVHSDAARSLAGAGSVAGRSPGNTARAGLPQRGLALLRSNLLVVGAVAVALPVLIAKLRGSKRTKLVVRARQDGAIAWISAGWDAFVLVRALQRNFGAGARSPASLPVKPSTPLPVSEKVGLVTGSAAGMRRFNLKSVYALLKASISNWIDDFAPSMGAALAYYTVFSIAPLLVIAIAVAALVFGQSAAQHEILDQLRGLLGSEGANAIESMLISAQKPKEGVLASALSIVMLLIGATTVFSELESDLNRIWRVPASKQSGIWSLLRARLLSLGLVVTIGFLLLVSLVANAALAAWGKYWSGWFFGVEVALQAANFLLSLVVFTLLFALMYKVLPRVPIAWRDVWVGAAVTSLLFAVGKFLIGMYIGKTSVASSYGAAGALVVLLVWVYYSSQVFLVGAEFTRAYAQSHGSRQGQATDSQRGDPAVPAT
jgi:membrane protein